MIAAVNEHALNKPTLRLLQDTPLQLAIKLLKLRHILRVCHQLRRLINVFHLLDRSRNRRQRKLHVGQTGVLEFLAVIQ